MKFHTKIPEKGLSRSILYDFSNKNMENQAIDDHFVRKIVQKLIIKGKLR